MTMLYNDFRNAISRKFGDTSTAFNALVEDFLADRLIDMEAESIFRDLQERFTASITPTSYTLSLSAINTAYSSDAIVSLKPTTSTSLKYMSVSRLQNDTKTDQTGNPEYYIPINLDTIQVFPIPVESYTLTGYIVKSHPAVTLTADVIRYTNDKIKALKFGVIADIYEDRGDDRYVLYERKSSQQLENCRVKAKQKLQSRDIKMELGN